MTDRAPAGPRVVSLVPSATETLVALGVTPVGCTRFCDLDGVARVGGTKHVDVESVTALEPDLVVVNDEENTLADAESLAAAGCRLHSMSPRSVREAGGAVAELAALLGVAVPAPFDAWDAWLDATAVPLRTSAFVAVWRRPYLSLNHDTYGSSLLEHVGVENVLARAAARYPEVTLGYAAALDPALVLLPSEPYAFGPRHAAEVRDVLPRARVVFVDGRDLFWWGIRTADAATRLRRALE